MSYGKLNKDIYENRRRLGYVTEMFEFYDKFSDSYGSRGDVDSCDKWILRVKRDISSFDKAIENITPTI